MAVTNVKGRQLDIVDVANELTGVPAALAVLTADLATFAQGALADSAVQPGDDVSDLNNDAFYQGRVVPGTTGDFAALDANGDIIDGGSQASDFATAAQGALADTALQNTTDTFTGVLTLTGTLDVSGGVDKLQSATTAIDVAAATAPTVGQILTAVSSTVANWQDAPTPIDAYLKLESDGTAGNAGAKINKVASASVGNVPTLLADGQLQQGTPDAAAPDDVTLLAGSATVAATAGASLNLTAGTGNTTADGGNVTITAGEGGATGTGGELFLNGGDSPAGSSNVGGDVTIRPGSPGGTGNPRAGEFNVSGVTGFGSGRGSQVDIFGGNGGSTSGPGGSVKMNAGHGGTPDGTGGNATIEAGDQRGTGLAGAATVQGGATNTGAAVAAGTANVIGGNQANGATNTGDGGQANVTGGNASNNAAASGDGGAVVLTGGVPALTGTGGAINLTSGDSGGGATGDGGVINIFAGDAVGTIGTGGVINIIGGASVETGGSTATGGDVNITGGTLSGTGSSNAGDVAIRGGENLNTSVGNAGAVSMIGGNNSAGTNSAGSASVFGGNGTGSANGGTSTLRGGAGGVTGLGGDARVIGGAGGATSGDAGDIVLTPGAAAGSGSAGAIVVTQSTAPSVTTDKLYNLAGVLTFNGQALLDAADIGVAVLAEQTIGIADNNLLEVDGTPATAEYARFTANGLEGRTEAEFKGDFNLEIGTDVLAEQTIGIADDNLLEVDGSPNSAEYARFTANGLEGRTEAEFKADFNLEDGVDVQAPTPTATTAELTAIANAINTTALKVAGYMVFNTTSGAPVWAVGAADGDVWNDATGTLAHTPA